MMLLGVALQRAARGLGVMALVAGFIGLFGTLLFLSSTAGVAIAIGTAERIADYPAAAMLVVLGAYLLKAAVSTDTAARLSTH